MSGTISMHLRTLLLQSVFTPDVVHELDDVWVALTYDVGSANTTGDQLSEPETGGYARASYAMGSSHWEPTGFSELYNTEPVVFPEVLEDWGQLSGWALVTAETSGMTLAVGSLINPPRIVTGMFPVIPPQALVVALYD